MMFFCLTGADYLDKASLWTAAMYENMLAEKPSGFAL
jgi:hypothetical protein